MLGRIGSGTFSEVFTVSLRETRAATKANEANERGGYSYVPWLVRGGMRLQGVCRWLASRARAVAGSKRAHGRHGRLFEGGCRWTSLLRSGGRRAGVLVNRRDASGRLFDTETSMFG